MADLNKKLTEMARMAEQIEAQAKIDLEGKENIASLALSIDTDSVIELIRSIGLRMTGDAEEIAKMEADSDELKLERRGHLWAGIARILSECGMDANDLSWILGHVFINNGWYQDMEDQDSGHFLPGWGTKLNQMVDLFDGDEDRINIYANQEDGCEWFLNYDELVDDEDEEEDDEED